MRKIPVIITCLLIAILLCWINAGCGSGTGDTGIIDPTGTGTDTTTGTNPTSTVTTPGDTPANDVAPLVDLINQERHDRGLPLLTYSGSIETVAQDHADYCANLNSYSPTAGGTTISQRLQQGGVSFTDCDECGMLGSSYDSAQDAFNYLNSNYASVLYDPSFTRFGVGHGVDLCST